MVSIVNHDAEIALLSILINNPTRVFDITDLKDFMFSSSVNQQLFFHIKDISVSGAVPEFNFLMSYLQSKQKLGECGGAEYLKYLQNQVHDVSNVKNIEKILIDAFKTRKFVELTSKTSEVVASGCDIDKAISDYQSVLNNLTSLGGAERIFRISDVADSTWESIKYQVKNPGITGVPTGYTSVDVSTNGLNPADVWVICGRPGMGKTAIMCNMALRGAIKGQKSLIFSLEMTPQSLVKRMLAINSGVDSTKIRLGNLTQTELNKVHESIKEIKDLPMFIDDNFNMSIDSVVSSIRKYHQLYGINVVYLDYIQILAERGTEAVHELGKITRRLKLTSKELEISSVILSQVNRDVESRDDKRPILSDLRQSGNIEEDADVVVACYRDEYYKKDKSNEGKFEFIIRKQREGPIGTLNFRFDSITNRISEDVNGK